jgi:hypothetical protein
MSTIRGYSNEVRVKNQPIQFEPGPNAPQFETAAQLKPVNKRLASFPPPPPVTNGVPLYCDQRGNEDRLFKAPIEDFHMILPGKVQGGRKIQMSDYIGFNEKELVKQTPYQFEKGIKVDGGRPLNPKAF